MPLSRSTFQPIDSIDGFRTRCGAGFQPAVLKTPASTPSLQKRRRCFFQTHCGSPIVTVDPRYFRPTEVETQLGDPTKVKAKLGWTPKVTFDELVTEMVREDLKAAERDELVKKHGYKIMDYHE